MGIISQVYITETKKLFIVPFLCFSAWCQEDSVCFPSLTCEKQKLVQTVVPRADPCGMSLQLPCVATGTTPILLPLHTHSHLHTERCCLKRKTVCVHCSSLQRGLFSVAVKQQRAQSLLLTHPGNEARREGEHILGQQQGGSKETIYEGWIMERVSQLKCVKEG